MRFFMKNQWPVLILVLVGGSLSLFAPVGSQETDKASPKSQADLSTRGPGMKGPSYDHLKLPVPRTFDLTHVQPEHFAAALGNDPEKIFQFVRDHIAYEVYTGCLRGPRGTLLAMAGNSVDRSALLASLLEKSGHKVRFARGTLPEAQAKELVTSMWAKRPRPEAPKPEEKPAALVKALETLENGVQRDYTLIRHHLQKLKNLPNPTPGRSLEDLGKEAQDHFWVQWHKDNLWIDLDPSFADAKPAQTFTKLDKALNSLPDEIFHWVELLIRLEEYPVYLKGDQATKPQTRVILSYKTKTMNLSGVDLVLTHQPENWNGPAQELKSALASAITNTGRIKPVLVIAQDKTQAGVPFRPNLSTGKGIGGIGGLLGGEGARKPISIATAESLHFDFIYPGGRKETVIRELYDLTGPARRAANESLTSEQVRTRTADKEGLDVALNGAYDLFFTTGRIDAAHFAGVVAEKKPDAKEPVDLRSVLRRVNLSFTAASDLLFQRWRQPGRFTVLFYPDSSRLSIVEHLATAKSGRITLDLRRDHVRIVAVGTQAADLFRARVFRGVVEGTLERVLLEYLTAEVAAKEPTWRFPFSTSSFFDQVQSKATATLLLPLDQENFNGKVPPEALARVRADLSAGHLVVAPEEAMLQDGVPRYAWWRIDPLTGETIALTDEGLHSSTTTELILVKAGNVVAVFYATARGGYALVQYINPASFERVAAAFEKMGWPVIK